MMSGKWGVRQRGHCEPSICVKSPVDKVRLCVSFKVDAAPVSVRLPLSSLSSFVKERTRSAALLVSWDFSPYPSLLFLPTLSPFSFSSSPPPLFTLLQWCVCIAVSAGRKCALPPSPSLA